MKIIRLLPDGRVETVFPDDKTEPLKSQTDWTKVKDLSEEEIEANALSDPDNPPLTDEELKRFKSVPNMKTTC